MFFFIDYKAAAAPPPTQPWLHQITVGAMQNRTDGDLVEPGLGHTPYSCGAPGVQVSPTHVLYCMANVAPHSLA